MLFAWKITFISPLIEVGKDEKKTSKKVVCIEEVTDKEYPERIAIDFIWQGIDLLNGIGEGDEVKVAFNARYNRFGEWSEVKVFNSLRGWKIDRTSGSHPVEKEKNTDDLPF